jgi:hypothetical protein
VRAPITTRAPAIGDWSAASTTRPCNVAVEPPGGVSPTGQTQVEYHSVSRAISCRLSELPVKPALLVVTVTVPAGNPTNS